MGRGRPKQIKPEGVLIPAEPTIIVQTQQQKRRAEPPLSERRVIKDSYKKKEELVHFNMGFMPGNSFRCQDCREGFAVPQGDALICPKCKSTNLKPHSSDVVR